MVDTNIIFSSILKPDIPFIVLSLALNSPLWTGDKKLVSGLKKKNIDWLLNTKDILKLKNKTI